MIETKSNKVVAFFVAEKSMVEYSGKMEPFATKALLIQLHREKINVRVLTTDRSGAVKSLMTDVNKEREEKLLPPIKHCFDGWHFSKSVLKDIWKAAKLKKCIALGSWIKSVKNQVWYAIGNCGGNADYLTEMILAIAQHAAGIHEFPDNQYFKACHHGPLEGVRDKPWLKVGSLAHKKLVLALRGYKDSRLKDLRQMTENQHTSKNEQLNNVHNIYMPKHTFFGPVQARVRACLAAIDHNCNVNRPAKKDVDGNIRYQKKVSRDGTHYTAIPLKVPKDTSWRTKIMEEVVDAVRRGAVPSVEVPTFDHLKVFGKRRTIPVPDMAELVAATKARSRYREHSKQ
jgi:solute carrier family 8 (sodium/calcium exchanger)